MKLILAPTVLLAGVVYAENSGSTHSPHDRRRARSMARLRALQQLTADTRRNRGEEQMPLHRHLSQLFDEFDFPSTCGAQCTEPELCSSYSLMQIGSPHCNAGCIPEFELTNCDWNCNEDGTATSSSGSTFVDGPEESASSLSSLEEELGSAAITAEQKKRMGMIDELVCDQCKFYRCCTSDEATTLTKYETCMHYIPTKYLPMMPDGMSIEEWEELESSIEELESIIEESESSVEQLESVEWGHGSDHDAVAAPAISTGTESTTSLSIIGKVVDSLECPVTCSNPLLCETILNGEPTIWDMEVACNSGCLPTASACEEYCGEDSTWPEIACNSCKFFQCCGEQDLTGDAVDVKFPTCQEFFPELEFLLPSNDWEHTSYVYDDHIHMGYTEDINHSSSSTGIDFLDEWADNLECPDICPDAELCELFLEGETGDTEMLKEACDSGCVPYVSSCDDICSNHDGSEFIASVVDMVCQACLFLQCCHSQDNFDTCQEFVPDLDEMMPALPEEFDGHANYGGGDAWAVSHSGTATASGLSFLGEMFDSLECADGCPDIALCDTFLDGSGDDIVLRKACNVGCLPVVTGCKELCENRNEAEYQSSVVDMACDTCTFLQCCSGDKVFGEEKFDECQVYLPAMGNMPEIDWDVDYDTEWEENWGENGEDWGVVEDTFGEFFDQLASIIEGVVNDNSVPEICPIVGGSFSCPIEGFCELFETAREPIWDITSLDYKAICAKDAFFLCGPDDFEEMCRERCGDEAGVDAVVLAEERIGPLDTPICSLCSIAMCCGSDGKSFEECVMATIGLETNDAEATTVNPVDGATELVVSPEESSADKSDGETADVAPSSDVVSDTSEDISVEDATSTDGPSSDASESSDNALTDVSADSTAAAGEDTPDDNLPDESSLAGPDSTEISESTDTDSDLLDSGSFKSRISVYIALPAAALLLVNSF